MFKFDFDKELETLNDIYIRKLDEHFNQQISPTYDSVAFLVTKLSQQFAVTLLKDYHIALTAYLRDNLKLDI
jgi:hypothetical protein